MDISDRIRGLMQQNDKEGVPGHIPPQELAWDFMLIRAFEYIVTGYKGRIVLDIQQGRINSVQDQAIVAGASQYMYYIDKTINRLANSNLTPVQ